VKRTVHVTDCRGEAENHIRHHTLRERLETVHSVVFRAPVFCDYVKIAIPVVGLNNLQLQHQIAVDETTYTQQNSSRPQNYRQHFPEITYFGNIWMLEI
jgi:hypothetical protein